MKSMEIKRNLKFAQDENILKFKQRNVKFFQCNNSQNFCKLNFIYSREWVFNLTMRNRVYTWMTSQRIAELQSIHLSRSCYTNFSLLFRLVICSFTCKQPFRLTVIIDQHSIFCVNMKFNIRTFETLASWYFKNEEIGEAVLIIMHIGLLMIMNLASTNSMYFSPQFWPFNIYTGYNHRQNVGLDCSLKCLCVIIRDSLFLFIPTFRCKGIQIQAGSTEVSVNVLSYLHAILCLCL